MILHPKTQEDFNRLVANPPHALLIGGEEGAGKSVVALEFIRQVLQQSTLEQDSTFRHCVPEKGTIGIDAIRILQKFLQLKTAGKNQIRRAVLIEDAHTMTDEAQNALLKILEEPPADTVMVLTAVPTKDILPTIYSRVQQLVIKAPTLAHITENLKTYKSIDIERSYTLSNGQMGLLMGLLESNTDHSLVSAIAQAKALLTKSKFERLTMIDELSKQKHSVPILLKALKKIARSALSQAAKQGKEAQIANWHSVLKAVQESERSLESNPNTKLLLTNLMLKI
mgnify:CR=1 FL=1